MGSVNLHENFTTTGIAFRPTENCEGEKVVRFPSTCYNQIALFIFIGGPY